MGNKVDISEVEHFLEELKESSSNLQTQLNGAMDSVETVNSMRSFSGRAANAAKQYFTDVHLTLLETFGNLFEDLQSNVEQHKKSFRVKVDANDNAIIESDYLLEVKEDIKEVYDKLEDEDETIHDTIQGITDISSATTPNFSDVNEWKNNSIEKIQEVDEDLDGFTSTGNEADVDEIMHQIEVVMESATANNGQSRFTDFIGVSGIRELQKLKAYNALKRSDIDEIVEELSNKMLNGETLNEVEREILYQYIQSELTTEDIDKINDTKRYLLGDIDKLKTYINESVLSSESSLESEIILLEMYLFTGNMSPSELNETTEERVALRSYLDALKNYHLAINEMKNYIDWEIEKDDPLFVRVEDINFNIEGQTQFSGHGHLATTLFIDYDQSANYYENREDFLGLESNGEYLLTGYVNISDVEYYYGQDAVTNRMEVEEDKLKDDMRTMTGEYIGSELLGLGIGMARNTVSIPAGILLSGAEHLHEKGQMGEELEWYEVKKPANKFKLEMKINDRSSIEFSKERQAELYPTDETYEIIDRWKAIHQEAPHFPYDEEAIANHDWNEMYNLFHEGSESDNITLNENDLELYNYLLNGTVVEGNETIDKIIENR